MRLIVFAPAALVTLVAVIATQPNQVQNKRYHQYHRRHLQHLPNHQQNKNHSINNDENSETTDNSQHEPSADLNNNSKRSQLDETFLYMEYMNSDDTVTPTVTNNSADAVSGSLFAAVITENNNDNVAKFTTSSPTLSNNNTAASKKPKSEIWRVATHTANQTSILFGSAVATHQPPSQAKSQPPSMVVGRRASIGSGTAWPASASRQISDEQPHCIGHLEDVFKWDCVRWQHMPRGLTPSPTKLRLYSSSILTIEENSLSDYNETLRDIELAGLPQLSEIRAGAFEALPKLRVVYIFQAPKLVTFDLALRGAYPEFVVLRIQQTGLRQWPDLSQFKPAKILGSVDLDNNRIETLGYKPIVIKTEILNLEFNNLRKIEAHTFDDSEIGVLTLKGNPNLRRIDKNAFVDLRNLHTLDLSQTGISSLPTAGLGSLRELLILDTPSLTKIPSIYAFGSLTKADLTYAHHCCAFRYPKKHDPLAYQEYKRLQENSMCQKPLDLMQINTHQVADILAAFTMSQHTQEGTLQSSTQTVEVKPKNFDAGFEIPLDAGVASTGIVDGEHIECGTNLIEIINATCVPEPDAFNHCEDIMGYSVLRVAIWFVVCASICGNFLVIVVLLNIYRQLNVPKFLQLNLALADFFMGVYLLLLASADLYTVGSYFNFANDWQYGIGCQIAGACSIFASQLSIFTLTVLTFDRYYAIIYSIDLNMRLKLGWAAKIMILGWILAIVTALLPIFGNINSYSMTSICLPMRSKTTADLVYILVLLSIDSLAFAMILNCYIRMYLLIRRQKTEATAKERTIAMRMALLVFTDFACWAPIIFFGLTALIHKPLISVTNSKILIVFFYPLNSMANPFLYVILTRQYKKDCDSLTSKFRRIQERIFRPSTAQVGWAYNTSNHRSNQQHQQQNNQQPQTSPHFNYLEHPPSPRRFAHTATQQTGRLSPPDSNDRDNNGDNIALIEQKFVCSTRENHYVIKHQVEPSRQLSGLAAERLRRKQLATHTETAANNNINAIKYNENERQHLGLINSTNSNRKDYLIKQYRGEANRNGRLSKPKAKSTREQILVDDNQLVALSAAQTTTMDTTINNTSATTNNRGSSASWQNQTDVCVIIDENDKKLLVQERRHLAAKDKDREKTVNCTRCNKRRRHRRHQRNSVQAAPESECQQQNQLESEELRPQRGSSQNHNHNCSHHHHHSRRHHHHHRHHDQSNGRDNNHRQHHKKILSPEQADQQQKLPLQQSDK